MQRGPFWPLEATKREKHYSRDPKILYFPFSGLQRPKMTFLHKIQKNSFSNRVFLCFLMGGHFWPLEARKREKPYCVDPKSLINLIKTLNFATFEPLDLQKWPAPQIKGLITAISEMPEKICFDHSKVLKTTQTRFGYKINSAPWWPKKNLWPSSRAAYVKCQLSKFWVKSLKNEGNFFWIERTNGGLEPPCVYAERVWKVASRFARLYKMQKNS